MHRLLRRLRSELDDAFDRFARHIEFPSLHSLHRIADLERRLHHGMPLSSIAAAVEVVEEDVDVGQYDQAPDQRVFERPSNSAPANLASGP